MDQIIIEIRDGCLVAVYGTRPARVTLVDWDEDTQPMDWPDGVILIQGGLRKGA